MKGSSVTATRGCQPGRGGAMPRVRVWANLGEDTYRAYQDEAERREVTVEQLVEGIVNRLLQELEHEQKEGADHPIIPS